MSMIGGSQNMKRWNLMVTGFIKKRSDCHAQSLTSPTRDLQRSYKTPFAEPALQSEALDALWSHSES